MSEETTDWVVVGRLDSHSLVKPSLLALEGCSEVFKHVRDKFCDNNDDLRLEIVEYTEEKKKKLPSYVLLARPGSRIAGRFREIREFVTIYVKGWNAAIEFKLGGKKKK